MQESNTGPLNLLPRRVLYRCATTVALKVKKAADGTNLGSLVLERDDTTLNHFVVQIVALAGSLADAGEDGVATVSLGDVVDQLHDQDSLADTGTAEQTDLTALGVGGQKVDDLDAVGLKKFISIST